MNSKTIQFITIRLIFAILALCLNLVLTSKWEQFSDPDLRRQWILEEAVKMRTTEGTLDEGTLNQKISEEINSQPLAVISTIPIAKMGIELNHGKLPFWAKISQGLLWALIAYAISGPILKLREVEKVP